MAAVTHALSIEVTGMASGTALVLGPRAAADAVWLTRRGWQVTEQEQPEPSAWGPGTTYDVVSAAFVPVAVLPAAVAAVGPGGRLLVVGDATETGAEEQVRRLALDPAQWELLVAEDRARGQHDAEGNPTILEDAVVLARRI